MEGLNWSKFDPPHTVVSPREEAASQLLVLYTQGMHKWLKIAFCFLLYGNLYHNTIISVIKYAMSLHNQLGMKYKEFFQQSNINSSLNSSVT